MDAESAPPTEPSQLEFVESHRPGLWSGDYRIAVTQRLAAPGITANNVFTTEQRFAVAGERFSLGPDAVQSVFPPDGSVGDHANVLPHIILNRSTLPWERPAVPTDAGDPDASAKERLPWLALLVFAGREIGPPSTVRLADLVQTAPGWPGVELESGQHPQDLVTVIDVDKGLLASMTPTSEELRYLAHVRRATDDGGRLVGEEWAVVMANRLPAPGATSVAHLVSVERRYSGDRPDDTSPYLFDTSSPDGPTDTIRLVSLRSWRFSCVDEAVFKITESVLNQLRARDVTDEVVGKLTTLLDQEIVDQAIFMSAVAQRIGRDACNTYQATILKLALESALSFKGLLTHLDRTPPTLRLPARPDIRDAQAEAYLAMGYVPCPHYLRRGDRTVSWYHGPLATAPATPPASLHLRPARAADALVRYHADAGMFDVSYAAAWELGRLLALRSKQFSVDLYTWKREHAQLAKHFDQHATFAHLPRTGASLRLDPSPELPLAVASWLRSLACLGGVPFNYLVPNERMLPRESIRFFHVDQLWIKCLLDGAFSVGRVVSADLQLDEELATALDAVTPPMSGVLVRSEVVAGWPSLLVDGYDQAPSAVNLDGPLSGKLDVLRLERLSPNVLLCLFAGDAKVIDVHQKPEALHYGLDRDVGEGGVTRWSKGLRNAEGEEVVGARIVQVPFRAGSGTVVDIARLIEEIRKLPAAPLSPDSSELTPAQFALSIIEGVERVRFISA